MRNKLSCFCTEQLNLVGKGVTICYDVRNYRLHFLELVMVTQQNSATQEASPEIYDLCLSIVNQWQAGDLPFEQAIDNLEATVRSG